MSWVSSDSNLFKISSPVSSVDHCLFNEVLFGLHVFVELLRFALLLMSTFHCGLIRIEELFQLKNICFDCTYLLICVSGVSQSGLHVYVCRGECQKTTWWSQGSVHVCTGCMHAVGCSLFACVSLLITSYLLSTLSDMEIPKSACLQLVCLVCWFLTVDSRFRLSLLVTLVYWRQHILVFLLCIYVWCICFVHVCVKADGWCGESSCFILLL